MGENYHFPQNYPHSSASDDVLYTSGHFRQPRSPQPTQADQVRKLAGVALGTGSIWGFEIISHPFIVLRRSCQIYHPANKLHLTPISLVPVMISLNKNKPVISMWKGFISNLSARGLNMVAETAINEATSWPTQVSSYSTVKKHCLHLLLKASGYLVATPFYVSSFVETVQSHGANNAPTFLEFFFEGLNRLVCRGYETAWILPMYQLLLPTAAFRLSQYCIQSLVYYAVIRIKTKKQEESNDNSSPVDGNEPTVSLYDQHFPSLLATFTGTFLADLVLYPFETVLHRLYVQGTRVLVDNMDNGLEVAGIGTQYYGVIDCFRTILTQEGFFSLYQGFGSFVLQYSIYAAGLKMVQYLFNTISTTDLSHSNGHRQTPQRRAHDY